MTTAQEVKSAPVKKKIGRPHAITPEMQAMICEYVADGKTVASFCEKHKHIKRSTVFIFMGSEAGKDFLNDFTRAREAGTHSLAEECIKISDDKTADPMRARLRIDTRLRLIGQWNRRVYGQKQDIEVTAKTSLGDLVMASLGAPAAPGQAIEHQLVPPMLDITPTPSAEPASATQAGETAPRRERPARRAAT